MAKKLSILLFVFTLVFSTQANAQVPKDFEFEYEGVAGQTLMGTTEKIVVKAGNLIIYRDAKHLGEGMGKKKTTRSFPVTPEQMKKLMQIVQESGFMGWAPSSEIPHQSRADEYFKVTMDGKTAKHTKWEQAHQEAFRILFTHFNSWRTDVQSARF